MDLRFYSSHGMTTIQIRHPTVSYSDFFSQSGADNYHQGEGANNYRSDSSSYSISDTDHYHQYQQGQYQQQEQPPSAAAAAEDDYDDERAKIYSAINGGDYFLPPSPTDSLLSLEAEGGGSAAASIHQPPPAVGGTPAESRLRIVRCCRDESERRTRRRIRRQTMRFASEIADSYYNAAATAAAAAAGAGGCRADPEMFATCGVSAGSGGKGFGASARGASQTAAADDDAPAASAVSEGLSYAFRSIDGAVESVVGFLMPLDGKQSHQPQANEPDFLPACSADHQGEGEEGSDGDREGASESRIVNAPTIEVNYDGEQDMIFGTATKDNEPGLLSVVSKANLDECASSTSGVGGGFRGSRFRRGSTRSASNPRPRSGVRVRTTPTSGSAATTPIHALSTSAASLWGRRHNNGGDSSTSSRRSATFRFDDDGGIELENASPGQHAKHFGFFKKMNFCQSSRHQLNRQRQEQEQEGDEDDGEREQDHEQQRPKASTRSALRARKEDRRFAKEQDAAAASQASMATAESEPTCEVDARDDDYDSLAPPELAASSGDRSSINNDSRSSSSRGRMRGYCNWYQPLALRGRTRTNDSAGSSNCSEGRRHHHKAFGRGIRSRHRHRREGEGEEGRKEKEEANKARSSTRGPVALTSDDEGGGGGDGTMPPSQYVHQDEQINVEKDGHNVHTIKVSRIPTDMFMKGNKYLL